MQTKSCKSVTHDCAPVIVSASLFSSFSVTNRMEYSLTFSIK